MVIKTCVGPSQNMDDSDIICLDSSQEEPPVPSPRPQSSFSVAPPQLCQRWTQSTEQHSSVRAHKASTQWHYPQPIITSVTSLSPQKRIVKSNTVSSNLNQNMKVGGFAFTPHHTTSPPLRQTLGVTQSILHRQLPSVNSIIQPTNQFSEIKIKEVKSLSPFKSKPNVKFNSPIRKLMSDAVMSINSVKKSKVNPECITLSDDEGCEESDSSQGNVTIGKAEAIKSEVDCQLKDECKFLADPSDENKIKLEPSSSCSGINAVVEENTEDAVVKKAEDTISTNSVKKRFIQACTKADSSEDMATIISKKVKKHYANVDNSFKKTSPFIKLLQNFLTKVIQDHSNVYVHIADLTAELKARKDASGEDAAPPAKKKKSSEKKVEVDYDELEIKRNAVKIKKLNKALTKIEKTIRELECKEVDWDDDDDSSYIMLQRYKERAVKIFNKLCDITKESKAAGNISKIHFSGTPFAEVNKCIEQFLNETRQFPDFVDICDVIKASSDKNNMKLTERDIHGYAETAFKIIGVELQRQRIHGHTESLLSLIDGSSDPAESDKILNENLIKNQENWKNIDKLIDEFAEKASKKKSQSGSNEEEEEEEEDDDSEEEDAEDVDSEEEDAEDDDSEEEKDDRVEDDNLSNLSSATDADNNDDASGKNEKETKEHAPENGNI